MVEVSRQSRYDVGLALGALAGLGAAYLWLPTSVLRGEDLLFFGALLLLGVAAGFYRPVAAPVLAGGAVVLPALLVFYGTAMAALAAGAILVFRDLAAHYRRGRDEGRSSFRASLLGAERLVLAVTAVGAVWHLLEIRPPSLELRSWLTASGLGAVVYAVTGWGLQLAERRLLSPRSRARGALAWGLDGVLLLTGSVIAVLALDQGWSPALILYLTVTLFALEGLRLSEKHRHAEWRLRELKEVSLASRRLAESSPEEELAARILFECRKAVSFEWLRIELFGFAEGARSWRAAYRGDLEEGVPDPPPVPPPLPGVHRRASWTVLERELVAGEEQVGRLTLWCDPRRLGREAVELLETLLPQMATSVHRALLDRRAGRDALTGLADRRLLEERLERLFEESCRGGQSLAVVMCDLDHFKRINDTYGHAAGDRALVGVARLLESHCRETDLSCRYGGEEFTLLLDRTEGDRALAIAERLRRAAERCELVLEGQRIHITVSFGVASFPAQFARNGRELLALADAALYEAKRQGRNRSLLNLGRGRFLDGSGTVLQTADEAPPSEAPTVFA